MEQLGALVPSRLRASLRYLRSRPVAEIRANEVVLLAPVHTARNVALTEINRVALDPANAPEVAIEGRIAIAEFVRRHHSNRWIIALPPEKILRKTITLPIAVEENLQQTLNFELDRLTPFRPEQVYFDAAVTHRDRQGGQLQVDWIAALRSTVDDARRLLESWGAEVVAVVPGPVLDGVSRVNLIPEQQRVERPIWRTWQLWLPLILVIALIGAVAIVPVMHRREYATALNAATERVRQQATIASALRQQLEQQQSDFNFILLRKYSFPSIVQTLNDITRILPDDTWLMQLEIKSTTKGKDPIKELLLRGESANAGKLINLLEGSKMVEQAAPRSPTTKIQPGPGEMFDLGAQLRALPPPAAVEVSVAPVAGAAPVPSPKGKL